jgi:hypothetical protein
MSIISADNVETDVFTLPEKCGAYSSTSSIYTSLVSLPEMDTFAFGLYADANKYMLGSTQIRVRKSSDPIRRLMSCHTL